MNGGRTMWLVEGTNAHMNNFKDKMQFPIKKNNESLNTLYLIME